MTQRQRKAKAKRRRHAKPSRAQVRAATISGSIAATAALGLASGGGAAADAESRLAGFDAALFKDINSAGDAKPRSFTVVGDTLFFVASDGPDSGTAAPPHGYELWKTDGTAAGTELVEDINPTGDSSPGNLEEVGGTLFFSAYEGAEPGASGSELWESDGSAAGTNLVEDINATGSSYPGVLTEVANTLFFSASDGPDNGVTAGTELWHSTDGTAVNTDMVEEINPNNTTLSGDSFPYNLIDVGGTLFFSAVDGTDSGTAAPPHGNELWKASVTPSVDAELVEDINPTGSSDPSHKVDFGGTLMFSATDGTDSGTAAAPHGQELWKSGGTAANTELVEDINPTSDSYPARLTEAGGTVFFRADDGTTGSELWKSGSAVGSAELVENIRMTGGSNPSYLTDFGGTLFFQATDGADNNTTQHGEELWKSGGTMANTELVEDINYSDDSEPEQLTVVGDTLFFSAEDGPDNLTTNGLELWKSGGAAANTDLVEDINDTGDSEPDDLTAFGGALFFEAFDGPDNATTNGYEPWTAFALPGPTPPAGGTPTPGVPAAKKCKPGFKLKKVKTKKGKKKKKCVRKKKKKR